MKTNRKESILSQGSTVVVAPCGTMDAQFIPQYDQSGVSWEPANWPSGEYRYSAECMHRGYEEVSVQSVYNSRMKYIHVHVQHSVLHLP